MTADSALTVVVSERAGYAVVTAIGSIDATTRGLLDEQMDKALQLTRLAVIVDLSEVDFCDSTGLNTFAHAHHKATARGIVVVTAGLQNRVRYVFTITRLQDAFCSQPDLDSALRWLENGTNGHATTNHLPEALGAPNHADHRLPADEIRTHPRPSRLAQLAIPRASGTGRGLPCRLSGRRRVAHVIRVGVSPPDRPVTRGVSYK